MHRPAGEREGNQQQGVFTLTQRSRPRAADSCAPWLLMAGLGFGFSKKSVKDVDDNSATLAILQHCWGGMGGGGKARKRKRPMRVALGMEESGVHRGAVASLDGCF